MRSTSTIGLAGVAIVSVFFAHSGDAQQKGAAKQPARAPSGDWPLYRHDTAGTGYSPLAQITVQNAANLKQAWAYRLQGDAPAATSKGNGGANGDSEATPIVVNGVMYLPATGRVVALEPETGKEIWTFSVNGVSRRGVAYMPGQGSNPPRIPFSAGRRLIALNATTGKLDPGFGKEAKLTLLFRSTRFR
jgi:quinoprotein glucose dehydrogenase